MSYGGAVESFSGATASAKPPLVKQCIDYVLTMYFYFYGVSICQSTFFISHLFPVFFAKAARQLLQVEHYDAVVEERSLEGLCGHPPCSEAVLEVPERNLVMNFHTASRKLPDSWMM